jgi:WD40 repeat protein
MTHMIGSIRSLFYKKKERYLFSGAFDGLAAIWEIGATSSESSRSKNVAWLKGGSTKKIKSICYLPSTRQVITGLETGWLAIWDTESGKLLRIRHAINTPQQQH